jgi:hypothetical protein
MVTTGGCGGAVTVTGWVAATWPSADACTVYEPGCSTRNWVEADHGKGPKQPSASSQGGVDPCFSLVTVVGPSSLKVKVGWL